MNAVSDSISVLSDRQADGIKLITSGLRRVEEGLKILIGELGMSVPQVHAYLVELDYEELSIHQLKRIATKMRKAGELPAATTGVHTGTKAKKTRAEQNCAGPVENSQSPPLDAEPLPISEPPTLEWSSELYLAINHQINDFLDKLEQIPTDQLRNGEWDQLALRGEEITKLCRCHQHNLQRDHGAIPEF